MNEPTSNASANEKTSPAFIHSKLDDAGLSPNQFRVYCHIVRRAGGIGGTYFESAPNCAAHCKVHIKTLRPVIAELLALNLIQLVDDPPGRSKTYRVTSLEEWQPLPNGYPGIKLGRVSKRVGTPPNPIPGTPPNPIPTKVIPVRSSLEVNPNILPVKLVNTTETNAGLTNLTPDKASKVAMQRISRDIAGNRNGWGYDNCRVQPSDISSASLKSVLHAYAGKVSEKLIHECWHEAVARTHRAAVDNLAIQPSAYAVQCFKEQLQNAASDPKP